VTIRITDAIAIEDSELDERFVRASGPGGQNVNKVSTAVELRFDVGASSLPHDVKSRLIALAGHHGLSAHGMTQHFRRREGIMEYGMTVHSLDKLAFTKFSDALRAREDVVEFRIAPTGD